MCYYPRLIFNPKYLPNKKNGGNVPICHDKRVLMVPIKCGKCKECRDMLAREWRIRLSEELRGVLAHNSAGGVAGGRDSHKFEPLHACYVTFTFSDYNLKRINKITENDENETCKYAVRHFLERLRKCTKKSIRHWLITEKGHQGTERIHMHGLLFAKESNLELAKKDWEKHYGFVRVGKYVNMRTINYILKYVTKIDTDHENYTGIILCSPGIGKYYIDNGLMNNKYNGEWTNENYRANNGAKMQLPIYYRNHIYTEEEREKLWIQKIEKQERWLDGIKYKMNSQQDRNDYILALKKLQEKNKEMGYGGPNKWKIEKYFDKMLAYETIKNLQKKW